MADVSNHDNSGPMHHVTLHKTKKKWYKRWWVWLIIAIVLIAIVSASGSDDQSTGDETSKATPANSSQPSRKKAAATAKIGQPVRDGKFEFTVNSVKCGETSVGDEYLNKKAQGQYCRLNFTVKNIGDEAQSLSSSDQYLYNSSGQKYNADDTATLYAEPSGSESTWYNDVNPGNSVTGDILFDIPADQTPATAELHDSAFSNGVKVSLK